jgi:hypothetical protein
MKGVHYVTDSTNKKVAVQIDLKLLQKQDSSNIEDFIDGIIAEGRKNESRKSLADIVTQLKKKGKL